MIKIRIIKENIITEEQEKMTLEQAIDFYNNNINSLVAMANGKQEKNPKLWKKFEKIALDSYQLIQNAMEEINKFSNLNFYGRKEKEKLQAVDLFIKNFTNYLKGEEFLKYPITSVMNIPDDYHSVDNRVASNSFMKARVLNNKVTSLIIPFIGLSNRIEEKDLEKLYYIIERYTKWYENFKGKLGSWSQRNLPTVRKLLKLREGFITEQDKITLSQIVGENSVISFDFDNTLVKSYPDIDDDGELVYINGGSNTTMINLMKHLIDDPSKKVYLVTSRSEEFDQKTPEQSVKAQLDKLGVQPDGIFFTNSQPKVTKLKELGVEIHFDDDRMEHGDIQGSTIQSFYPDDFLEDTNQVSKVVAVTLDNKVLILKRADTGEMDIPGGHGKSGETPEFTAIRETLEETGLDLFRIKEIMSKEVEFKGRKEQISYFYAKLNNTSEMLTDDIDLDTDENTEFYFVDPQNIDEYMSNATNNLKNVANQIKSLTLEEQNEPFQRMMAAKHRKMKKKLIGMGGNKTKQAPYNQNPSFKRSKSAPVGFGGSLQEMLTEIEFDLSKFSMKSELCPKFWQNQELKNEIRDKLIQIANDFIKNTPIEDRIEDITFTGSLTGYNYSDSSDIDLHILVDFGKDDEIIKNLMNALRINWNNNHDIRIMGHEVEIYVQDSNEKHYSSGIYSLSDDKWLQKPSKDSPQIDTSAVLKKAEGLSDEIDALQKKFEEEKYKKVYDSTQRLRKKLKNMRSAGLEDEGIYSIENLAFKLLRNSDQINKLMILDNDSYDKMMGYDQKSENQSIKVKINRVLDEKRKKKKKKRKKRKKRATYGGYYPYFTMYDGSSDGSGGDAGGDGGGGE